MKKKVIIPLTIMVVLLLAVAYRFLQILPYPVGGGQSLESPDKQFTADAMTLTDCSFFGSEKSYYEFTVKSAAGNQIRHIVMDAPPAGPIHWRGEGVIQWAVDNSAVTYSFDGTQLILSLKK